MRTAVSMAVIDEREAFGVIMAMKTGLLTNSVA